MLIGNVGQEPEVRYFDADQAYARLRLATTERGYTLPNGTQVPDRTDWHNLLFNKKLATNSTWKVELGIALTMTRKAKSIITRK